MQEHEAARVEDDNQRVSAAVTELRAGLARALASPMAMPALTLAVVALGYTGLGGGIDSWWDCDNCGGGGYCQSDCNPDPNRPCP